MYYCLDMIRLEELRKTRFSSFLDENLELTKKTYWGDASLSELNNDIDCLLLEVIRFGMLERRQM